MVYLPAHKHLAIAGAFALILVALGVQSCRLSDRDAELAVRSLERAGWTRDSGRPVIPDLPHGARPVVVVSGGVRYLPRRAPAAPDAPPPPNPAPAGGGCDLDSLTVDLDCRAEVARAGSAAVARLWVRGLLADGARTRELFWHRVGDPVPIRMPDGGVQPVETASPEVRTAIPRRLPWSLDVRAGVTTDAGVRIGATWYPSGRRWGIAADWEHEGDQRRAALLGSVRLGPS